MATFTVDYLAYSPFTATYDNGTAGVGATLTNSYFELSQFETDDSTPSVGNRILFVSQDFAYNGIYELTDAGSSTTPWVATRATDYDQAGDISEGDIINITSGFSGAGRSYIQTKSGPFTIGTSPLVFLDSVFEGVVTSVTFSGSNNTPLDTYEEFSNTGNATGIWASPQACNVAVTMIGRQVCLHVPAVSDTANAGATVSFSAALPSRFRPDSTNYYPVVVNDNGTPTAGLATVSSAGDIVISASIAGGNFAGAGASGWNAFNMVYSV